MTANMLADHVWQSTIVASVAWLIAIALRQNRAGARYGVWLAASLKFLVPFAVLVSAGSHLGWRTVPIDAPPQVALVMDVIGQPFSASTARVAPVTPAASWFAIGGSVGPVETVVLVSLFAVWLAGVVAVLATWWTRWRRVAAILRAGTPFDDGPMFHALRRLETSAGVKRPLTLVVTDASLEPGVFGILKPVLLWPRRISEHLQNAQIEAILAHEVSHVRRRDNLAAAVHMVVQAIFWFDPLVWWLGSRLVDERERACDEDVVRLGSEPQTYAESILKTCQFYVESPLACVAGVTGSDLKKRIEHIMTDGARATLNPWKKCLLAAAAVAAIIGPIVVGVLSAPRLRAQSATTGAKLPTFEVASVKPNNSGDGRVMMMPQPGGRINLTNVPLRLIIRNAYRLQDFQIVGGPDWLNTSRFDVTAKADGNPPMDQMQLMLRSLLADRFKLVVHNDTRELPIYALVMSRADGKTGAQLKKAETDCSSGRGSAPPSAAPALPPPGQAPTCGFMVGPGTMKARGANMVAFTGTLSGFAGRVVTDRTGLSGGFDIDLAWTPDQLPRLPAGVDPPPGFPQIDPNGPSLFTALQEQLGLKLESTKGPVDVLVIDRAEKPSED